MEQLSLAVDNHHTKRASIGVCCKPQTANDDRRSRLTGSEIWYWPLRRRPI